MRDLGIQAGEVVALVTLACALSAAPPVLAQPNFLAFESDPVRPLAITPDGSRLIAVNTPDNQIEVFDLANDALTKSFAVQVGMEPVAVAARSNDEVWVVNHLSDSISIVDISGAPRVVRTLLVGDEPRDIVFAGTSGNRAFITTAHRGQNSPFPRSEYDVAGVGRADVWVFDADALGSSLGGDPLAIVTLFGDRPRALAVTVDRSTVYAAVFRSGNATKVVSHSLVCDGGQSASPCVVNGVTYPGGLPAPNENHAGAVAPEEGLILKLNRDGGTTDQWQDELGRDWSDAVKQDFPDLDVFAIDANGAPPAETASFAGVGSVLFNMIVNPISGVVYVTNTDAQNHVRFEGAGTYALGPSGKTAVGEPASVRGHLHESRISILSGGIVTTRHLNKHIPYGTVPVPAGVKEDSLAIPTAMAITTDGNTLYVAAFGSSKIGVFQTGQLEANSFVPDSATHISVAGGGPSGLLLHGNQLFVFTRFDNAVVNLDRATGNEVQRFPLHTPEPDSVVLGRPFLYDAVLTSSNGETSCASCHIFGDMDDLPWDLGDPDGDVVPNLNMVFPSALELRPFHPVKGPMTTQSLRGLENQGPEHWRGDRQGDASQAFDAFSVAFGGLLGRDEGPLGTDQMTLFRNFSLQLRYPPNPMAQLDNSLRLDEAAGQDLFDNKISTGLGGMPVLKCEACHTINPAEGFFGSTTESITEGVDQDFKIPHFRNLYQKVGMFGFVGAEIELGDNGHKGDQVRGSGFAHDGRIDTLRRFLSGGVFDLDETEEAQIEAFLLATPTDLAPIVGQQVTLTAANSVVAGPRIDLLVQRAAAPFTSKILGGLTTEAELVAKLRVGGHERGYVRRATSLFEPDDDSGMLSDAALRTLAATPGSEITYTAAPPGSGTRMGIDRDLDTLLDGFETGTGVFVSATDTGTMPDNADSDGDGVDDGIEVAMGTDPNVVPEPSSAALAAAALSTLAWLRRRRQAR